MKEQGMNVNPKEYQELRAQRKETRRMIREFDLHRKKIQEHLQLLSKLFR